MQKWSMHWTAGMVQNLRSLILSSVMLTVSSVLPQEGLKYLLSEGVPFSFIPSLHAEISRSTMSKEAL